MLGFNLCAFKCSDSAGSAMLQALDALLPLKTNKKKDVFFWKAQPFRNPACGTEAPCSTGSLEPSAEALPWRHRAPV